MRFLILLVVSIFSLQTFSAELSTPSGFVKIRNGNGADLYRNSANDVYVQVVDLQGGGGVSFHGFANSYNPSVPSFYRQSLTSLYNNNNSSGLFSAVNGQFFDNESSITGVAFPVKTQGLIRSSAVWDNLSKRTFMINYSGYAYIKNGYSSSYLNDSNMKEVLVGLHPNVNKSSVLSIGRSYIGGVTQGCNPSYATCAHRYVLFFVAKNKRQSQMQSIASSWGVHSNSLVMMDGSGSAQMKSGFYGIYGSRAPSVYAPDYRAMPHAILTYENQ